MLKARYRVVIIESERDWGQKVDSYKDFKSLAAAKKFQRRYNAQNSAAVTPDWYMAALDPELVDLSQER